MKFSEEQREAIARSPPPGKKPTVKQFISFLIEVKGWRLCKNGTFRQMQKANHFPGFFVGTKKK